MKDEALKLALEALIWTTGSNDFGEGGQAYEGAKKCLFPAITAIKEALAQPEQDVGITRYADISIGKIIHNSPPPQRTWVGLTEGEVDKMILLMGFPPDWITENAIVKNIVRNLEAKLKEKNT